MASLRRTMAALCAGFAVFAVLQAVSASVAMRPVVVTTRAVSRGTLLREADVTVTMMPDWQGWRGVLADAGQAVGNVVQIDVDVGQPLFPSSLGSLPAVPKGHTVVGVQLASSGDQFVAGDLVTLVAGSGCAADAVRERSGMCVLADRAMVMVGGSARDPPDSAGDGNSGSLSGGLAGYGDEDDGTVSLAMPPDDALAVMAAQREGPIMAVEAEATAEAETETD
ncbi:cation transport ATPase [Bifidobacterium leontopitheci]|uniref:Cation transport ATPase n=2 Tax=Bifidobacterium leontopitheci TaxID=2650774 RepID=A0A6I1GNM5_9BIFI|nr:cation transport ATPase [Bifidobacterium leontopitheci]